MEVKKLVDVASVRLALFAKRLVMVAEVMVAFCEVRAVKVDEAEISSAVVVRPVVLVVVEFVVEALDTKKLEEVPNKVAMVALVAIKFMKNVEIEVSIDVKKFVLVAEVNVATFETKFVADIFEEFKLFTLPDAMDKLLNDVVDTTPLTVLVAVRGDKTSE
jgi:hypothetical protein